MIAALYNLPASGPQRDTWAFHNANHHLLINNALRNQKSLNPTDYILDPMPEGELQSWLFRHQQIHSYMDTALGIQSNDLNDVDFNDKAQLESWVWSHGQEHKEAAFLLGIES